MNRSTAIAALLLAAGTAPCSHGAILAWDSNLSGNASNANNWSPGQVPTSTDELHFLDGIISGNYTVTYDGSVPRSLRHFYRGDDVGVRITNAAGHLTGSIDIDTGGSAYLERGLLVVSGDVGVGANSGSGGHLTVDASTLRMTGVAALLRGTLGPATVRVTAGGTIDAANTNLLLDPNSGFTDTLLVDVSSIATFRDVLLGQTSGAVGTVDASSLNVNGDLRIGGNPTGDGQLVVRTTSGLPSVLTVTDDIFVSSNTNGLAAGSAILQISGAAARVTCDQLNAGDIDGGSAIVRLSASSRLTCASASFLGSGTLDLDLGELTCNGDFLHTAPLTIDGGSVLRLNGAADVRSTLIVGNAASGVLTQHVGTLGTYQACVVANLAGSNGNISLDEGAHAF
ncbi:MAG: hypothetical protein ACOYN0_14480, partial [Phycisphaerales bacterium]